MKNLNIILLSVSLLLLASCKDYLNLVPKNERVVSTAQDVKVELLSYWASHTYSIKPLPSYGQSRLSLPIYNDVNVQLAIYEDNMNALLFREHGDIGEKVMTYYYEDVNWKGISLASSLWVNCYSSIGFMNAIVDDLARVPATQTELETIGGEAKVIRAWCIFKLLQFFAPYHNDELGVPLNLDSENTEPSGRRSQSELYTIILDELEEVLNYSTPGEKWNYFYSKDFIYSFLAEVYMFKSGSAAASEDDWKNAAQYADLVVETYTFEETPEQLSEMFSGNNLATVTDHPYCALKLSTERSYGIGKQYTGIWGQNNAQQVSEDLWNLYDVRDIRCQAWFKERSDAEGTKHYINKPTTYTYGPVCDILTLYRKADVFLIYLEALCHTGQTDVAAEMLKKFRQSRIPGADIVIGNDVLAEVLKERRMELCFENGSRWLDMKRLGIGCNRMGISKESANVENYTLEANDYRFALPIPASDELNYNADLSQNPGWTDFE